MIERKLKIEANRNASELGLSNCVKFEVANAASLPFQDGYFDFVVSTLSLHHNDLKASRRNSLFCSSKLFQKKRPKQRGCS